MEKSRKQIGEAQFKQIKAAFKGKILPAIHPESIRVRLISQDIIGTNQDGPSKNPLHRGLRIGEAWNDLGYASVNDSISEIDGIEALVALSESKEGKWYRDDEILDDKWVQKSRKKGKERGSKPDTGHLEGLNWEVLVVDEPVVNAFCLPGGKIVVFTGLLQHFRTDPEIATIIGHEVGLERGIAAAAGRNGNGAGRGRGSPSPSPIPDGGNFPRPRSRPRRGAHHCPSPRPLTGIGFPRPRKVPDQKKKKNQIQQQHQIQHQIQNLSSN
ncbi:hypothetical protein ACSBR2_026154 [Camellia fascicularis]